jgi:hypothetical protein
MAILDSSVLVMRGVCAEGADSGWSVQNSAKRLLIDARDAHLINRHCSSLNGPPQPSLREGIPA